MKKRGRLEFKSVWSDEECIVMTFRPDGLIPRGVTGAYMNMGGDFVVTIQIDQESPKLARKRIQNNRLLIDRTISAMTVKL